MQQQWGAPLPYAPPPPPRGRSPWGIIAAIVALLVVAASGVGAYVLFKRHHVKAAAAWSDADCPVPVTSDDPTWGQRAATVTLVFFADFEDATTASMMPTIATLESMYGPAQLRVVWKHLPTSNAARDAAEASAGAHDLKGDDAFWHFADRAFSTHTLSAASYETWASESGVDVKKLREGIKLHTWQTKVEDDERLAHTVGAFKPPVSFVNGIQVTGAEPLATWQHVIDDELTRAHLVQASGVAPDRIYVTRAKDNFGTSSMPFSTASAPATATATATVTATATATVPAFPVLVRRIPLGPSPALGPRDALITIVEFADFQCPYCKRAEATLATVRAKYGSDLRIVWKNQPLAFHTRAAAAAELALEARDERGDLVFWAVHDELYAVAPTLDDATLMRIARGHGVSEPKAMMAISSNAHRAWIADDQALAKKVGATGTPTFFINGRELMGAQPASRFEEIIDDELTKARARVASGTRRDKVYDAIMADSTDPP
jgi:protein-disulfide isomerase